MQKLALGCCLTAGEPDSDVAELCDLTEEEPFGEEDDDGKDNDNDSDDDGAGLDDGEEWNLREEYRTRGYVEVDEDYYIRMAEMPAWLVELLAKSKEVLEASGSAVPFGALHPRIRQPLMQDEQQQQKQQAEGNIKPSRGRVRTEEDVDKEIITFLRRLRDVVPESDVRI